MFIRDAADFYINTRYIKTIYIEYGFRTDGLGKDILVSADLGGGDTSLVGGVYKRYVVSPNSAILAVFDDDEEGRREAKRYLAIMANRINRNIGEVAEDE